MTNTELLELLAILLGVIIAFSYFFQRLGEERMRHLIELRERVERSVESLEEAVAGLRAAQQLHSTTIEVVVTSLDLISAHLESNGGVVAEILEAGPENAYPAYEETHSEMIADLRRSVDELRAFSPNGERRLAAVKNLAFGQANFRAYEVVQEAVRNYPDDEALREFGHALRSHLAGR
jgi:hypothetical protein